MKYNLLLAALLFTLAGYTQTSYEDSIRTYLKGYVQNHEVVKGHDKSHMKFYEISKDFRVVAEFTPAKSTEWLSFKTSGIQKQVYRQYGTLSFQLSGETYQLNLYQSQDLLTSAQYKDYLFLPFTDATNGSETYSSGRYLELYKSDIRDNKVVLDFNKAYNPYCAYVSGVYNCPIPPKENALAVAIKAGEKAFSNTH